MKNLSRACLPLFAAFVTCPISHAFTATYDASLGTVPTAQGWTGFHSSDAPAPTVSGGILRSGPTSAAGFRYWQVSAPIADFIAPVSIKSRAKIIDGPWVENPARAAFSLSLQSETHFFNLLIAADRIGLLNRDSGTTATVMMDNTSSFKQFELRVGGNTASAYVDGVLQLTAVLGNTISGNKIAWFGDGTGLVGGTFELTNVEVQAVPEPATWMGISALVAMIARRKKKTLH